MPFQDKFIDLYKVIKFFCGHPLKTAYFLRALPEAIMGSMYCANYKLSASDMVWSERPTEGVCSDASINPLRRYIESHHQGRGIWKWDHYIDIYRCHLNRFIGSEAHIVEVGVGDGGSLEMWKNYFGGKCRVYGIDIRESCRVYEDDRTKIFIGDQADRKFWGRFKKEVPKIDILIDDGGHLPEQQIVTLEEMLPHIRLGGVYICEDVHGIGNRFAHFTYQLGESLNITMRTESDGIKCTDWQKTINSIHLYPSLIVIQKNDNLIEKLPELKHGIR